MHFRIYIMHCLTFPVLAYHDTKRQDLEKTFHRENNSEHSVEVF